MDTFSRNAILVLFGSAMLLGMGLVGIFGRTEDLTPGLQRMMSGPAPFWLIGMGAAGIAAVLAVYLKGALPQDSRDTSEDAGGAKTREEGAAGEPPAEGPGEEDEGEDRAGAPMADATLALVEMEVLLRPKPQEPSPALGSEVPPSVVCRALLAQRERWHSAMLRASLRDGPAKAKADFRDARERTIPTVPIRGRADGEAASYRLAALVHVPPSSAMPDAAATLELLGGLPGDRFVEVALVRVPEQADTFASTVTVAGKLASENLLEDSSEHRE